MNSIPKQHLTRDASGNGRQTFLFSATMSSNYDEFVSKDLLFGENHNTKQIVECGQTSEGGDDVFTKTVEGLKQ